jgi:MerR family mercuric resistance operon transcriptional regulator
MTIGRVAGEAGVSVQTVRYYERRGLIPRPPRRASGYRIYPEDTVRLIRFIRHAKELGFSLGEISELLSLRLSPEAPCSEVKKRARAKLEDIEGKMTTLGRMKRALEKLERECTGRGPVTECPILEALEK